MSTSGGSGFGWLATAAAVAVLALALGFDWSGDAAPAAKAPQAVATRLPETARDERVTSPFGDIPAVLAQADASAAEARAAVAAPGPLQVPPPSSSGAPHGLTPEQWRQLEEALHDHPQRAAELDHIVGYLAFSKRLQQFQTQRTVGASRAALLPLASALQGEIDTRLARGELAPAEAENLETELLEVLETDSAERERALAKWRAAHAVATGAEADAPELEFGRQLVQTVEDWLALPDDQRNAHGLRAELRALRESISSEPNP